MNAFVRRRIEGRASERQAVRDESTAITTYQLIRRCKVTERMIQWWCEAGLLRPRIGEWRREFSPQEVARCHLIAGLRSKGISLRFVDRALRFVDRALKHIPPGQQGYLILYMPVSRVSRMCFHASRETVIQAAVEAKGSVLVLEVALSDRQPADKPAESTTAYQAKGA